MRVPRKIEEALVETGLPWAVEQGSRHAKIRLGGHFVGILPHRGETRSAESRADLNIVSQIRRKAKELQG